MRILCSSCSIFCKLNTALKRKLINYKNEHDVLYVKEKTILKILPKIPSEPSLSAYSSIKFSLIFQVLYPLCG